VFVSNVAVKASRTQIREFFEQAGEVNSLQMIEDRRSGRHKGFGYVEYASEEGVTAALGLSGTRCAGFTVQVQRTQAEKNRVRPPPVEHCPRRLHVGGLHPALGESHLRGLFSQVGPVAAVEFAASADHALLSFDDPRHAHLAQCLLHGLDLGGRKLIVGFVSDLDEQPTPPLNGTYGVMVMGGSGTD
jgi:RNA recognition motif-containing protein